MNVLRIATLGVVVSAVVGACSMPTTTSCEEVLQCGNSAAGSDSGGTAGKGGTTSKGGSAGKGGSSPVTTTAKPCNGECSGNTPVCDADANQCVACLKSSDCTDSTKPVCDTSTNKCVGCLAKADCKDAAKPVCNTIAATCVACLGNSECTTATASRCDTSSNSCSTCSADSDCSHIAGKTVCDAGACVQCTGAKYSMCGTTGGKSLVCDSLSRTCSTTATAQSAGLCKTCISDAQCPAGQLCYQENFGGKSVGYSCFWKQGDTANGAPSDCTLSTNRPFVKVQAGTVSIDGSVATLCMLRSTTCTAYNQFSSIDCAPTGIANDALCGFSSGIDSKCAQFGTTTYRCTTTCLSSDDCKSGLTCDTGTSPNVCTFQ